MTRSYCCPGRIVSRHWTAAGMFALFWATQGSHRNLTGQPSFLLDRQITSRWDAFAEYRGTFRDAEVRKIYRTSERLSDRA